MAIVGRSGSGKTTLVKCLAGLLGADRGRDRSTTAWTCKTLNYRDLRRQIGFVLQENYLFDDTIARNIAFGEDEPDMDRVLWAARVANAHEFIERLPLGYDTKIGESGLALSGGQRQRIAIARARLSPAAGSDLRRGHQLARHRVRARRAGEHRPAARRGAPRSSSRTG